MRTSRAESRMVIAAPIERVFEQLTNHEGMRQWPGVSDCRLVVEGTPRNGIGAIRRVRAGGLTLDEKVVRFEPPRRFDYTIVKGLPVEHLGVVSLAEVAGGVEVHWRIEMSSRVPLLARVVTMTLRRWLPRALRHLARELTMGTKN